MISEELQPDRCMCLPPKYGMVWECPPTLQGWPMRSGCSVLFYSHREVHVRARGAQASCTDASARGADFSRRWTRREDPTRSNDTQDRAWHLNYDRRREHYDAIADDNPCGAGANCAEQQHANAERSTATPEPGCATEKTFTPSPTLASTSKVTCTGTGRGQLGSGRLRSVLTIDVGGSREALLNAMRSYLQKGGKRASVRPHPHDLAERQSRAKDRPTPRPKKRAAPTQMSRKHQVPTRARRTVIPPHAATSAKGVVPLLGAGK